jgi:hypothetical protein
MDALERIIEQAQLALRDEPIRGLEDTPLGAFGLSIKEMRLGNIIAIARVAQREGVNA